MAGLALTIFGMEARTLAIGGASSVVGTGIGLMVAYLGDWGNKNADDMYAKNIVKNFSDSTVYYNISFRHEVTHQLIPSFVSGKLSIDNHEFSYVYNTTTDTESYITYLVNSTLYGSYNGSIFCFDNYVSNDWTVAAKTNYTKFQTVSPIVDDAWYSCPGQLYSHSFFDIDFMLCYHHTPLFIVGANFKLDVISILPKHETILVEGVVNNEYCLTKSNATNHTSLRGNTVQSNPESVDVEGKPVSNEFWSTSTIKTMASQVAKNPNICFIHGMGATRSMTTATTYPISEFSNTWTKTDTYFPYSSGFKSFYWSMDTTTNTWQTQVLLQETLNWMISNECSQVYAHSMGNIIMNAINQRIGIDLTVTQNNEKKLQNILGPSVGTSNFIIRWNALSPPFKGSWAAYVCIGFCTGSSISPLYWAGYAMGYCANNKPNNAINSIKPVSYSCTYGACTFITSDCVSNVYGSYEISNNHVCYSNLVYNNYSPSCCNAGSVLYPTIKRNIPLSRLLTGKVCGTSSWGITVDQYSMGLAAISSYTGYGDSTGDDGMVAFSSCALDNELSSISSTFGTSYMSSWYKAEINHGDTAGYNFDGVSNNQKPGMWFNSQVLKNDASDNLAFQLLTTMSPTRSPTRSPTKVL